MFVLSKTLALPALILLSAPSAYAVDAQDPTIPITIDLSEVQALPGPLYVSIQKEAQYMGMRGHGGIIASVSDAMTQATYKVDVPGRYAVSLWHDLNDDGVFSMDESYNVLDGWGASGSIKETERPSFDDVAIDVPAYGTEVRVTMFYPE